MIFSIDPVLKTFDPSTLGGAGERLRIVPGPLHTFQVSSSSSSSSSLSPSLSLSLRLFFPPSLSLCAPISLAPCPPPLSVDAHVHTRVGTAARRFRHLHYPCRALPCASSGILGSPPVFAARRLRLTPLLRRPRLAVSRARSHSYRFADPKPQEYALCIFPAGVASCRGDPCEPSR